MDMETALTDKERVAALNSLSDREWEVANLALRGFSNKEIGAELFIAIKTVEFHLKNIFTKFGIHRRIEMINFFFCDEPLDWRKN